MSEDRVHRVSVTMQDGTVYSIRIPVDEQPEAGEAIAIIWDWLS